MNLKAIGNYKIKKYNQAINKKPLVTADVIDEDGNIFEWTLAGWTTPNCVEYFPKEKRWVVLRHFPHTTKLIDGREFLVQKYATARIKNITYHAGNWVITPDEFGRKKTGIKYFLAQYRSAWAYGVTLVQAREKLIEKLTSLNVEVKRRGAHQHKIK